MAPLPGYVSNYVPRPGTGFSADFGGCPGVTLRRLGSTARVGRGTRTMKITTIQTSPRQKTPGRHLPRRPQRTASAIETLRIFFRKTRTHKRRNENRQVAAPAMAPTAVDASQPAATTGPSPGIAKRPSPVSRPYTSTESSADTCSGAGRRNLFDVRILFANMLVCNQAEDTAGRNSSCLEIGNLRRVAWL